MSEHLTRRPVNLAQLGRELAGRLGRPDPVGLSALTADGSTTVTAVDVPADVLAAALDAHAAGPDAGTADPHDTQLVAELEAARTVDALREALLGDVERRSRARGRPVARGQASRPAVT